MTGLLAAVLSGFALAALAPLAVRTRWPGWLLAILPAGLTLYFLSLAPRVLGGERVSEVVAWVPSLGLQASFALDGLGLLFALLICGIGALVLVHAGGYLKGHAHLGRFYALILAFMASMLGIVLADNLLLLYVFWGGTSITSYLLIGFEHARPGARSAALQALLVTVAGELALLGGFVLLGQVAGDYQISALPAAAAIEGHFLYLPIVGLVLFGALTKSAQFPFHFWLPNAMAAPAPVSAYLHSATMVKAGVFLLLRLTPALGGTTAWVLVVTAAGLLTMLIGAFLTYHATEVKRVLAYSTVSALGLMTMLVGIGDELAITAAIVFLLGHALYKGALFLFAGAADHEAGARDTGQLGGLRRTMPISATAALLAGLSMAGVAPFLGFVGKELAFEAVFRPAAAMAGLLIATVAANALLVAVAVRVGARPFFGRGERRAGGTGEAPPSLWLGPLLLAMLGLATGLLPGLLVTPLVASAVGAAVGRPADVDIYLWHGLTIALGLSAVTLLAGAGLYYWRDSLRRLTLRLDIGPILGPQVAYAKSLALLDRVAHAQTRLLQDGYLRHYVLVTVGAASLLVIAALVRTGGVRVGAGQLELRPTEVGLAALILVAALVAVRSQSRLGTVAALGVVGYGVALIFLTFGAPDLALTQVLIETLTVIVFVLVLYHLPQFRREEPVTRTRDAVIALVFGGLMSVLVLATLAEPPHGTIATYFLEQAYPAAHGRNVVNVILVDFRALDTMGEIAVLALAGLGVLVLLRLHAEHRQARR